MNMHKLITLRGNSGSGKTTVAKELQKLFGRNSMLISQDVFRREILNVVDGENPPVLPLLQEMLQYGNRHCEIVILEGILIADWYKSLFDFAVELYGSNIFSYYFDVPFEETLKRHQTRAKSNEFGEKEMREWWKEKDYSKVLNEKIITSELDKESIVKTIYLTVCKQN